MLNLQDRISNLPGVGPFYAKKFKKLGITSIEDLFYHVPSRYVDYSKVTTINNLKVGETVTVHAKINSLTNVFSKRGVRMQIGSVEDATGKLVVVWFNQPFLQRMLYPGRLVSLSGKVGFFNRKICLSSPDYEILEEETTETLHTGRLLPIYPETADLSSKVIRSKIRLAYKNLSPLTEFLSQDILLGHKLMDFDTAVKYIHFPDSLSEIEAPVRRLAFNELLFMHLKSFNRKKEWRKLKPAHQIKIDSQKMNDFIKNLPFTLTGAQMKAIEEIINDLGKSTPMNRLLEGDVGSGKTVVAAAAAYLTFINGYQTVIMAPTQILAEQHFKSLSSLFNGTELTIKLVTSAKRSLESADILVGTHALLHQKNLFQKTALVVIDEQHRFGVEQRSALVTRSGKNSKIPHLLTMTATPIPRTIALTTYGDLDLSVLNETPKGRQKITTWVVPENKRQGAYQWVAQQISNAGSQVFWICPLIEESEKETMSGIKAVTQEFETLKNVFPKFKLGLLHGKLKPYQKQQVLEEFRNKKFDILVATPVVEVGIDIPNATVIAIEAAERFGLAGLHQLRGRVGRGTEKSYCLLFSNIKSGDTVKRLKAMETMHSGFELAELDLKLRGPGEIFGNLQSGFSELKVASWSNLELIKETQEVALEISQSPQMMRKILAQKTSSID